ncbi:hypothetical protein [Acidovorax sp. NCPPB 3576]|nr:hypothetical protein [Acidovorax sp. NCPPB 3576]WCM90153.1 hypothetical protein M5C98_09125 [Acidovorax sp. NCPPB 3576]
MKNKAGIHAGFFSPSPGGTREMPPRQYTVFQKGKAPRIANAMNSHL